MRYLFLGGPFDGQWIKIEEEMEFVQVPIPPYPPVPYRNPEDLEFEPSFKTVIYQRCPLREHERNTVIYRHSSVKSVLARLIDGYRQPLEGWVDE